MEKLLAWLPAGGLGIMFLVMAGYLLLGGERVHRAGGPGLVLVLEDFEEEAEMLVRWLRFRRRWWESPVELTMAVVPPAGETLAILERLHKEGEFQIAEESSLAETTGNRSVLRLQGRKPIPWEELRRKLKGREELPA